MDGFAENLFEKNLAFTRDALVEQGFSDEDVSRILEVFRANYSFPNSFIEIPPSGGVSPNVSRKHFKEMTYHERLKLKESNPELYKLLSK